MPVGPRRLVHEREREGERGSERKGNEGEEGRRRERREIIGVKRGKGWERGSEGERE